MSPTVKALLLAGAVVAAGAVVGYGVYRGLGGGETEDGVTSPLDGFTRTHLTPPSTPNNFDPPYDTILGTNVAWGFYPATVTPDCGPFAGGTGVTISGDFDVIPGPLTAAQAAAAYWVYFGGVLATFDDAFDPNTVTKTEFHVLTPVAPQTGPVDVTMIAIAQTYYANMADAFTYFEPFDIDSVNPTSGPSIGGNGVTINAASPFPIHDPITTAAEAATHYRVLFGTNVADFDDTGGDPMTPSEVKVFAPAGTAGSTVDVTIEEIGVPCNVNTLPNAYTYNTTLLNISTVAPAYGYVKGGLEVDVIGSFDVPEPLDATEAAATFEVRMAGIPAPFREVMGVAMHANAAYVISPVYFPPNNPPDNGKEVVDAEIEQLSDPSNVDTLVDSFTYVAIDILDVTPASGTIAGGNTVKITAFLSIENPSLVDTASEAYDHYGVYFGTPLDVPDRAPFDSAFDTTPGVIVPPLNDIPDPDAVDALETAAQMYVIAPAHLPAEFVDVWVLDMNNLAVPVQDVEPDGYEYLSEGLGDWVGVELFPPYVGALDSGELTVKIETTQAPVDGWSDGDVFIVPQGGDPENPTHRIPLDYVTSDLTTENEVSVWTNGSSILQILVDNGDSVASAGDLFTDGHAALYIIDPDSGIIYGNNFLDLSDSGRIRDDSQNGLLNPVVRRHFIIDTIPPVFIPDPDPAFGRDLVRYLGSTGITLNDIAPAPGISADHPAPAPAGERATEDVVDSESSIPGTDGTGFVPGSTGPGAHVFLNTASDAFTNNFPDEDMDIVIEGRFVDLDLHSYYDIATSVFDEDRYDGNKRFRQPAGFPAIGDLVDRTNQPMGDSVLGGEDALWVQWLRAAGSDPMPQALPSNVNFLGTSTGAGGVAVPSDAYFNWSGVLEVEWDFDAGVNDGIPQPPGSDALHWAIQFRAHDRGGFVTDESGDVVRLIMTPFEQLRDPLHVWWMRRTSARLVPNLEGLTVYDQNIGFELDRGFTIPLTSPGAAGEPEPLFSYRLWRSTVPGQGGYDAEYEPVPGTTGWTVFDESAVINTQTDVVGAAASPEDVVNRWILIQVLGIDEAGNYGQFPDDQLVYDFGGTGNITQFLTGSGASWARFFLLEQESSVDTRIRPTIWYDENNDGVINAGERVILGGPTVLQAPEDITQEQIRIRFQVEAIADPIDSGTIVDWTVSRRNALSAETIDGNLDVDDDTGIGAIDFARAAAGAENLGLDLKEAASGAVANDAEDGGPTTFVFRFRTMSGGITDSTPATYSVTVVEDIEEFVESRGVRDNQPIKETTR